MWVSSIKTSFANPNVLLCNFHALKFIRTLVSTAVTTVEIKALIFDKFKNVLYSNTEEIYKDLNDDFLSNIRDIEVRRSEKYVSFYDYYKKKIGKIVHTCG